MDYYNIHGEVTTPSTENMAYEQTNNRISNLEESIQSDIAEAHQNINEAVREIDNRVASEISTIDSRINTIIAHNNDIPYCFCCFLYRISCNISRFVRICFLFVL